MYQSCSLFLRLSLRLIYVLLLIPVTTQAWGTEPLKLTAHEQMLSNWVTQDYLAAFTTELNNLCGTNFNIQINWQSFSGNLPEFEENPADFSRVAKFLFFSPLTNALQKICRYEYAKQALQENVTKILFQRGGNSSSTKVDISLQQKSLIITLSLVKGEIEFFNTQAIIEDAVNDPKAGLNLEFRKNQVELIKETQKYVQEIDQVCKQPTDLEVDLDSFVANRQVSLLTSVDDYFFNPFLLALDQFCNNDSGSKTLADLGVHKVRFIYVPSERERQMKIKDDVLIIQNYISRASSISSFTQNQIYIFLNGQPSIKQ